MRNCLGEKIIIFKIEISTKPDIFNSRLLLSSNQSSKANSVFHSPELAFFVIKIYLKRYTVLPIKIRIFTKNSIVMV